MSYQVWVYKYPKHSKIIDSDDLAKHLADGWVESPADVKKPVGKKAPEKAPVKRKKAD